MSKQELFRFLTSLTCSQEAGAAMAPGDMSVSRMRSFLYFYFSISAGFDHPGQPFDFPCDKLAIYNRPGLQLRSTNLLSHRPCPRHLSTRSLSSGQVSLIS